MARVKRAQIRKVRKKDLFNRVKGFFGSRKRLRQAHEAAMKADRYAFEGRKQRKRQFRALWIQRISAAVRPFGLSYSRFIAGLKQANIDLNRKSLAELAIQDAAAFETVVKQVQAVLV